MKFIRIIANYFPIKTKHLPLHPADAFDCGKLEFSDLPVLFPLSN